MFYQVISLLPVSVADLPPEVLGGVLIHPQCFRQISKCHFAGQFPKGCLFQAPIIKSVSYHQVDCQPMTILAKLVFIIKL